MQERTTIRDVANHARVSIATVSAVINKSKHVSAELSARVKSSIRELDYSPNQIARNLKVKATKTIGLVFPNIESPIWPTIVRSVQSVAQSRGFDTFLLANEEDKEKEKASINSLLSKRVDGIIITPAYSPDSIHEHIDRANKMVPIVLLERRIRGIECVLTNNEEISYSAVRHLVHDGHKKIGIVTAGPRGLNVAERISGYKQALLESDLFDPSLMTNADSNADTLFQVAKDMLGRKKVDAIFATSQSASLRTLQAARELGMAIPRDVALFGYDYMDWMTVIQSPLSTVRQPIREMATLAATLLLDRIETGTSTPTVHLMESSLLIQSSCGCKPTEGENMKATDHSTDGLRNET